MPRLAFRDLAGYLKGYIDLVFEHGGRYYVLDWKSNHLGYSPSDYGPAEVRAAMTEHSYALQYLLYSLAVDRYLRHRIPGYRHAAHFGGVLYLFVRGVRPDWVGADGTPAGVFFDRPSAATHFTWSMPAFPLLSLGRFSFGQYITEHLAATEAPNAARVLYAFTPSMRSGVSTMIVTFTPRSAARMSAVEMNGIL